MSEIIDAKGLACPQPVILTKKALESCDELIVLVDNAAACDNVKRMAVKHGCAVEVMRDPEGIFHLDIRKRTGGAAECNIAYEEAPAGEGKSISGDTVFVITSSAMGSGDDELGAGLMKAFIHTASELDRPPDVIIFYNSGVKLAAKDSAVIEDLKILEGKGSDIKVCGTCANFFSVSDRLGAGKISNMYDIVETLSAAGRIVRP
jgi:selenium metabolism protein YedF